MATQWHPLFARLLRPLVEGHYDVQTNLTVGDLPREADLVLLRRTAEASTAFQGIWQHLTTWNVLEFKGPTVSARVADVDLLVELGLGIDRRLNEQRCKDEQPEVERAEVSFWYLANHLGVRFLRDVRELVGDLPVLGPGIWRIRLLGRWLVLVSNQEVPVDHDSVPIHLLVNEPTEATRQAAQTVVAQPDLIRMYAAWLQTLFPDLWREVEQMVQQTETGGPVIDFRPVIEHVGLERVLEQVGFDRVIAQVGLDRVIAQVGLDRVIAQVGLDRVIAQVGLDRVIAQVGLARVLQHVPMQTLLSNLSADNRRELRQLLNQGDEPKGETTSPPDAAGK